MSGSVIGIKLNLGWLGKITRSADNIVETRVVSDTETLGIEFGAPVFINDDNTIRNALATADTLAKFAGFAIAEVRQSTTYGVDGNFAKYLPNTSCDILTRGSIIAVLGLGDGANVPVAGGAVFVRTELNALDAPYDGALVGDVEVKADGTNTIKIPASFTTGYVDGNNCVEVTLQTKNSI